MTCRRAKEFLSQKGFIPVDRDFFKQRLSEVELRELLKDSKPASAFAWKSPRAKNLNLSPDDPPPDEELIRLMIENPYLIRRPIIRIGERTFFRIQSERAGGCPRLTWV